MTAPLARLTAALADRYKIERELGQGGMATVYLAEDLKHQRQVAIKVLREDLAASMGAGRFLREIRIAAQLQHPHILPLLDSGDADGFLYYVMPYVKGQSLRERLSREGELPVAEVVRLMTQVVDALALAHEHGVVHRDIKPDNVMLSGRHALVTDFGVAKAISEAAGGHSITTLGIAVGTPAYMSPEQAAADPHIDLRSDIYSVGVMMYELLSGAPPFTSGSAQQVLAAHVTQEPEAVSRRRPGIPPGLEQLVMRCLAKRPADRWQSAGEMLAQLELLATPSGGVTPTTTRVTTVKSPAGGRSLLIGAVGLVAVAVVAAVILMRRPAASFPLAAPTQLSYSGRARIGSLALSPDGQFVGYSESHECPPSTYCPYTTVIQETSPGGARSIVDSASSRFVGWSRDSRHYLVITGDGVHWHFEVRSVVGGEVHPLAGGAVWSASPDTLFEWNLTPSSDSSVWVRTVSATSDMVSDSFRLANATNIWQAQASPDGRFLLLGYREPNKQRGDLAVVTRQGVVVDTVPKFDGTIGWGPHSDRIYLRRDLVEGTWVMRQTLDHNGRRTGSPTEVANFDAADMSVGGGGIAYLRRGAPRRELWTLEWTAGPSHPPITRRVYQTTADGWASISRDGTHITIGEHQATTDTAVPLWVGGATRLRVMPFIGGELVPFGGPRLANAWGYSLSRDETRAIIAEIRGGRTVLTIVSDLQRGVGRELATTFADSGGPSWLSEHRILWETNPGKEFVVLDDQGTVLRRIQWPDSLGLRTTYAKPAPDGSALAILVRRLGGDSSSSYLYRVSLLDGGVSLMAGPLLPEGSVFDWAGYWSADGWLPLRRCCGHQPEVLLRIMPENGHVVVDGPLPIAGYGEEFDYAENRSRAIEWVTNRSSDVFLLRHFDPDDR